jgi:crossover junction endodeoxyribonuclease RusA
MADQDHDVQARKGKVHAWIARGKRQAAMNGGELNLRVDAVTTQTRRFRSLVGEFVQLEFKRVRPVHGAYELVIEIERQSGVASQDAENVAEAVLDALTGIVFKADSPVEKLLVTKRDGSRPRVSVTARPLAVTRIAARA